MKDAFRRVTIDGDAALSMTPAARRELAQSCINELDRLTGSNPDLGEKTMQRILQPLFALSGYRLCAEPESRSDIRFDLVAENLFDSDDRVLVEYKFVRDGRPRDMVPDQIAAMVQALPPKDPCRVVMVSNGGFAPSTLQRFADLVGPRLEFWSFDDVRNRLQAMLSDDSGTDRFTQIVLDFLDKLALAVAMAEIELARIEWRDMERLVAHVFRELGYAVALTRSSHDGGRDVVVADIQSDDMNVFNVEVKHWTEQRVGHWEVCRLVEVALRERRQGALMLATAGVSRPAIEARSESMKDYLRFGAGDKIALTSLIGELIFHAAGYRASAGRWGSAGLTTRLAAGA